MKQSLGNQEEGKVNSVVRVSEHRCRYILKFILKQELFVELVRIIPLNVVVLSL